MITIDFDVPAVMRDGTVLRADVYRPEGPGPFPVIVARTPYDKSNAAELLFIEPLLAARRGLIAVVQDVRGRGRSEGEFIPLAAEAEDGADTIAWARTLPGANGSVATWGLSYLGNVQWQLAAQRPDGLKAIAPMMTMRTHDDGFVRRGGAYELGLVRGWALGMGFEDVLRRKGTDEASRDKALAEFIELFDTLPGDTYGELPTQPDVVVVDRRLPNLAAEAVGVACDVTARQDLVCVPSFHVAGWYDIFVQPTIDNYCAAARSTPARLLIGPWNHISTSCFQGELNFGAAADGASVDLGDSVLGRTFDWLASRLNDEPEDADLPVKIFVMGENVWRSEAAWPLERAVDTRLWLGAGGRLGPEDFAPDSMDYVYDPADPAPTRGGAILLPHMPPGPVDQSPIEERDDVLVFTTDALPTDVEVTGRVTATLAVETDADRADWVVRLCDVHPDGRSVNITDGIARSTMRPGEGADVHVDLWSTSNVFKKGHRIRVHVTSSSFPRWDRTPADGDPGTSFLRPAHQRIYLGAKRSWVTLPIVPRTTD